MNTNVKKVSCEDNPVPLSRNMNASFVRYTDLGPLDNETPPRNTTEGSVRWFVVHMGVVLIHRKSK